MMLKMIWNRCPTITEKISPMIPVINKITIIKKPYGSIKLYFAATRFDKNPINILLQSSGGIGINSFSLS